MISISLNYVEKISCKTDEKYNENNRVNHQINHVFVGLYYNVKLHPMFNYFLSTRSLYCIYVLSILSLYWINLYSKDLFANAVQKISRNSWKSNYCAKINYICRIILEQMLRLFSFSYSYYIFTLSVILVFVPMHIFFWYIWLFHILSNKNSCLNTNRIEDMLIGKHPHSTMICRCANQYI